MWLWLFIFLIILQSRFGTATRQNLATTPNIKCEMEELIRSVDINALKYEFVLLSVAIDGAIKRDNSNLQSQTFSKSHRFILQHLRQSLKNEATFNNNELEVFSLRFQLEHFVTFAQILFCLSTASVWRILHVFVDFKIRVFLCFFILRVHFRQMNFNYDKINNLNFVTGIK